MGVEAGAMGGAFWGMLFGLLFFAPFLGLAIGAAMSALFGKLGKTGLDRQVLEQMDDAVPPGDQTLDQRAGAARWAHTRSTQGPLPCRDGIPK